MQLTLWSTSEENQTNAIAAEHLAANLIHYFGHWAQKGSALLHERDYWTVKYTLVHIHKAYTREQLETVSPETWEEAWRIFWEQVKR
jgi:hypothetical protein